MFQPETEDMLPRMAPKPSASAPMGSTEPMVRPQVPEVSILFGAPQQPPNTQMPLAPQATSYAAWKKQILPKVTFPPSLATENQMSSPQEGTGSGNCNAVQDFSMPRSNLYPLRAATIPVSTMALAGNVNSNVYMASNGSQAGYTGNCANVMANPVCYRRSLDSCSNSGNVNYQPAQSYRPPVETTPPYAPNSARDVLTICAGTQTDGVASPVAGLQKGSLSGVASKKDVDEIRQIVEGIRHDQMRLMQILETYVFSQQGCNTAKVMHKDAAIQVEYEEKASPPLTNGCCPPVPLPTNKFIEHLKPATNILQTPKGKPMAQSTQYRPNSPQSNRVQEPQQITSPNPGAAGVYNQQMPMALPKSSTDKSLVMNELALKYLPNEKLNELLKELNITPPSVVTNTAPQKCMPEPANINTPLRNVENFERNPTDISNASYKYLKKYRLLPEDHHQEDEENDNPNQPYDAVRNSPGYQRQQPNAFAQQTNSPFQQQLHGRLPPSPLVRASPPPQYRDNMLNLENIKQQPKFL